MALTTYNKKRNFTKTPEPAGKSHKKGKSLIFVVQKHDASHLHYDFRLEMEGVLKSWAVPKGPSLNPSIKRLAMEVEDHPWSYRDFEGEIPEGNYGAGDVIVWDTGTYDGEGGEKGLLAGLKKGHLSFTLHGKKLKGEWSLVRTGRERQWLLMKKDDQYASKEDISKQVQSVLSDRLLKRDGGTTVRAGSKKKSVKKAKITKADLAPMLATLTDAPFDDPDWLYEVKWDGFRLIVQVETGKATLYSRNGIEVTKKYPAIAEALRGIPNGAVIDGELVALDAAGKPRFQLMQHAGAEATALVYYAFDLLFLDGEDLRALPLIERKERLLRILPAEDPLRYSEHIEKNGKKYFAAAKKQDLEGIMAKRKDSTYHSGQRSRDWLKVKASKEQEVLIVGYTASGGSRKYFGSLVLAVHENGKLRHAGNVGTGFDAKLLKELYGLMQPLGTAKKPFAEKIPEEGSVTWLKPKLIAEIKFTEWTAEGHMRHPVFLGLRTDKKPSEVTMERALPVPVLTARKTEKKGSATDSPVYTHLDKVFWPDEGYTKGDVIAYYDRMADTILPYLKDRPMVMNRHPNGIAKPGFYQKDTDPSTLPDFADTVTVFSESNQKDIHYVVCNNKETLLYLANLGCIELNPWSSRVSKLNNPDFMVIDLDPGTNTFEEVITVAKVVHEVLEMSCEKSYVKTSGKTGLHIFVPLKAAYDYDRVRTFAEMLVRIVHSRVPELTSLERSPAKRKDKIYLDWLQNRYGQTLAAPYSLRPIEGACVSAPLEWKEVKKGLRPDQFTIKTIEKRLKAKGDLWKGILQDKVDLRAAITCLEGELEQKQ
jgi:bifunctional non-homologous end joining protein LigD